MSELVLTEAELNKLEFNRLKLDSLGLQHDKVGLQSTILTQKRQLLRYQIDELERAEAQNKAKGEYFVEALDKASKQNAEDLNAVRERLKINGKFGYDPDTRKIILDD